MKYWTIDPSLIACGRSPKLGEDASRCLALMHHFLDAIFSLNLPDISVQICTTLTTLYEFTRGYTNGIRDLLFTTFSNNFFFNKPLRPENTTQD